MNKIARYAGQAVLYGGLMVVIGYFADTPTYKHFPKEKALIKLSFVHSGKAKGGCRIRTKEELSKLAPNMRMKKVCSKERLPLVVEMDIDGKRIFEGLLPPTGLRSTGPSMVYKSFPVATGPHKVAVRMRDSDRKQGFDYTSEAEVTLKSARHFVIQFRAEQGEFTFR